jgi:2-polyprenyl-6-methoxyphenol hydroxylase-like FAD-dependent oxidoreductase
MVPTARSGASGEAGWDRPGLLEDVLPHYAHWSFDWLDIPDLLGRSNTLLHYPMVDRDPLANWGEGRVTLLGDAAHLMYPIGANGASQAILDAVTLADELAADSHGDVAAALARYESVRLPATTAIIQANRDMDHAERAMAEQPDHEKSATLAAVTSNYRATVENREPLRPS